MTTTAIDSTIEKLRTWFAKEKADNKLVDIKFYPAASSSALISDAAKEVLAVVHADESRYVDVTEEEI